MNFKKLIYTTVSAALLLTCAPALAETQELLNVSYDPTRELYTEYNKLFQAHWKKSTGKDIKISQSHGGSGKQARGVIDGLPADVITLALAGDVDAVSEKGKLLPASWESSLPNHSSPYTSTIVFLVRKGNPKKIKDWNDLGKPGVSVITPNPKTSGGAQWNYLAAWGYGLKHNNNDEKKTQEFVKSIYKNVPVLDTGARGSTTTFVQRGIGDVFISWENEAFLAVNELGKDKFDIIVPSTSILAEPSVAVVDKNANKRGNLEAAREYLKYLYSPEAQEVIAKNYYRPTDKDVAAKYAKQFPTTELLTIRDFGGWKAAKKKHFEDGGTFDQIYSK